MDEIIQRAKRIRLAGFDVDGVLSNGSVSYGLGGIERQEFSVQDGQGLAFLKRTGVELAIITGSPSNIIKRRADDLKILYFYGGQTNKLSAYEDIKQKTGFTDEEIAYVGDDFPDLPILKRVGLAITVPGASALIKQHAHWTTQNQGGQGAVREICDLIMQAQGTYQRILNSYLDQ